MNALQIDTDASRAVARTWAAWADQIDAAHMRVAGDVDPLWLGEAAVVGSRLAGAATELWTVSGFLTLLADEVEAFDAGAPAPSESTLDRLMWLAGGARGAIESCPAAYFSGPVGDTGDTFRDELRSPYDLAARDDTELGRQLVVRALQDTARPGQLRKDEFEIVRLTDGRYLVALPGVIDLTHFGLGHDPHNDSVRDLDQSALRSSLDTSVGGNAYAQMVWSALLARGVPLGSELVIVGHSFGADTALDLASDHEFNGPNGFEVTHVVAAGYDSDPQLEHVPAATQVLALQNRDDVPVLLESAEHVLTQPLDDARDVAGSVADRDIGGVATGIFGAVWHSVERSSPVLQLAPRADDVVDDLWHDDVGGALEDAALPTPSTKRHGDSQVDVVFDGGFADFGHHQDRYIDYLDGTTDPLVLGFLGTVGAGTAVAGTAVAVDVSVPDRKQDAQKT